MTAPEPQGKTRRRRALLEVVAYVLVPGERRRRAGGHFRRAGFEILRGIGEFARPERPPGEAGRREQIEIE